MVLSMLGIPLYKRNRETKVIGDVIYKPSNTCHKNSIELTNKALTTTTFKNNIQLLQSDDTTINKDNLKKLISLPRLKPGKTICKDC